MPKSQNETESYSKLILQSMCRINLGNLILKNKSVDILLTCDSLNLMTLEHNYNPLSFLSCTIVFWFHLSVFSSIFQAIIPMNHCHSFQSYPKIIVIVVRLPWPVYILSQHIIQYPSQSPFFNMFMRILKPININTLL